MEYFSFVDIENKKVCYIGKIRLTKHYLPYLAYKFHGKPVVIFGDETYPSLEEKYELRGYGGEYDEFFIENEDYDYSILDNIEMSCAEFNEIYNKIGGRVINNIEDYIRYKYKPI